MKKKSSIGFTLIELMIVITIIMLLAALIIVSVSSARARARDGKRVADLANIQLAMDMYKDSNGQYPANIGTAWRPVSDLPTIIDANFLKYLSPIPKDPIPNNSEYFYKIRELVSPAGAYLLMTRLEDADNIPTENKLGNFCYCIWGGTATSVPATVPPECN